MWTMGWAVFLGGGHLVVWACCGPLLFGRGGGRGAEVFAEFQVSMTPPAGLAFLAFIPENFRWGEMSRFVLFSVLGVVVWALGALLFWFSALSPRYRVLTGRDGLRYPDVGAPPRGRRRPRPPLPDPDDAYSAAPDRRIRRRDDNP